MKKRYTLFAYFLIMIILCGSVKASAKDNSYSNTATDYLDGIISYNLKETGTGSINEWIAGPISENIGGTSEWYMLGLIQHGDYDLVPYAKALSDYVNNNETVSASARLKFSLLLAATGQDRNQLILDSLEDGTIGAQGIMSYVFGLHLLNNGFESSNISTDEVIEKLSGMQHADGGWSISGDTGDVDVTAMTLTALSPHKEKYPEMIERGLGFLSEKQLEDGDYLSYGARNAESTAQVITALSALSIDCRTDARFIKNGNSPIDGLFRYHLEDGSFSHKDDKKYNATATVQVFYSLVAYERLLCGKGPLFILDKHRDADNAVNADNTEDTAADKKSDKSEMIPKNYGYKPYAVIAVLVILAAVCIILFILKKNRKNYIFALLLAAAAILVIVFTNFSSAEDYYGYRDAPDNDSSSFVTMSINCGIVADRLDSKYIPENGCILKEESFGIKDGYTVYDVLTDAARKYGISVDHKGSSDIIYISGINYLYELEYGDLSGWVYKVNGELPSVGCASYVLDPGDRIEWCYTLDLGNDTFAEEE